MGKPRISIIVPVYNVEIYLKRCIDSILNQTVRDFELILVNDGSTDNSGVICDEYKKIDSRIKVIHKKNGGLSEARNYGLDYCNGELIGFVDSDDFIEKDMYKILLKNMEFNNCDISIIASKVVYEENNIEDIKQFNSHVQIFNSEDIISKYLLGFSTAAWSKLYKRELFENVRFPVGKINEDFAIMPYIFHRANKICYENRQLYYYVKRANSITTRSFNKNHFDRIEHGEKIYLFIQKNYPNLMQEVQYYLFSTYISIYNELIISNKYKKELNEIEKKIKKNCCKIMRNKFISHKSKIFYLLLIVNKNIYIKFYNIYINRKRSNKY